ncbi:MAG: (d)CMP kinase [Thermomicrobiales bacterium]
MSHARVIAIDGPAAAGKSTVARLLADRLGMLLFDTGALYRAVSLLAIRNGVDPSDGEDLADLARSSTIEIGPRSKGDGRLFDVLLDGEDVTWRIRSPEVGAIVSRVSEHAEVRQALLSLQRKIVEGQPVVMVGRDIGTVVVPDAGLKIYLDASPEERAKRRYEESLARGGAESYEAVLTETQMRDRIDGGRAIAPLRAAEDAVRIRTDDMSVDEVVDVIERLAIARGIVTSAVAS